MGEPTDFTQGGVSKSDIVEGFYGWFGFGGSVFQWNPELNISFAYVPSDLLVLTTNVRGHALEQLAKECVENMDQEDGMNRADTDRIDMDGFGSIEMGSDS